MTVQPAQLVFEERAKKLVAARYSLVFVETFEEERLERVLASLAGRAFSQPVPLHVWSLTEGLVSEGQALPGTQDPVAALDAVIAFARPALFLFRDLHRCYGEPRVARRLREACRALRNSYKTIFVSGPSLEAPLEVQKELSLLDLPLPNIAEMDRIFADACASLKNVTLELGDERDALLRGALGLTEDEARQAFIKLMVGKKTVTPAIIEKLYEEKRDIVRREGILDYVPPRVRLEEIGGLAVLKDWLRQRQRFFSREAEDFGLSPPKGLLITGISGCGKSMAVQAVSTYWHMPLMRLDMNRVYAGVAGSPERTLERALRTAESIAPCVLWIDEIETAIVGAKGEGAGPATRIFSSFLTWMQEKEQIVFVAATANEIDKLPPELLRKGRFDEIFFVDLPSEAERMDIFSVHLKRRNQDLAGFDLVSLSKSTPGFNGAEIEQVVLSALYGAFDQNRGLTMKDLYRSLGRMVPLSTTMSERIKEIKRWADTRAVKASAQATT
ncbi:MAG: AAA family ATPase [Deltaproteobacteria bacterium]|nr:AAA family ATPase [Deltaproteobacteria bacterium]